MNWAQLKKSIGVWVRLEPPACRLDGAGHVLPELHDDWTIQRFSEPDVVVLRNTRTDHVAELGKDHVYDFRSDPGRSKGGVKHGFLVLKVQVFMQGASLWVRPNTRPGERVTHTNRPQHKQLWTPFLGVDASELIPPNTSFARIQYRLWSEEDDVPLLIRIASQGDGACMQECSGPSGVVEQMITERQTFYVSVSHPKVRYEVGVLGYRFD